MATLVAVITRPVPAAVCDCVRLKPLSGTTRQEVPFIFSGTVVEIVERNEHTTRTYDGGASTSVRPLARFVVFRVTAAWSGVSEPRVQVGSELSDCMFPFEIGPEYLVFAHRDARGRPTTNICTRTSPMSGASNTLAVLGSPSYRPK
jgi:hypothetical protein